MDNGSFNALTRSLNTSLHEHATRRGITRLLGGLALGGPLALLGLTEVEAKCKKACGPCKRCKKGKCKPKPAGTVCAGGTCQGGVCVPTAAPAPPCSPQDPAEICAPGCGTRSDNCGRVVVCPCPGGRDCLSNTSCGRICGNNADCPAGCGPCSASNTEGVRHCNAAGITSCDQVPQVCTSTAECPEGQQCQITGCGGVSNRCFPLCTA